MISRLIKNKGIFEFLEATKLIKKKYKNVKFTLIGEILNNNLFLSKEKIVSLETTELYQPLILIDSSCCHPFDDAHNGDKF